MGGAGLDPHPGGGGFVNPARAVPAGEVAVEAQAVSKRFGELVAVDGISFRVRRGECYGILGPNGAGKTTTIRMVYGYSPPSSGRLTVLGHDVARERRAAVARIGVAQQDNNLDPDLTVEENLLVFSRYFDVPTSAARERSGELLRFISLEQRRDAGVPELSGGMQRRLVLARALVNDPDLLVLDEPTTGLDPQSRQQLWERLQHLRARGLTVLLTTHYMEEAERLCDRLLILDQGRILVEGSPAELIRAHAGRYAVEVSDPSPGLRALLAGTLVPHEDLGHRIIAYAEDGEALFRSVSAAQGVPGAVLRMASLEDVFLKLTGRGLRDA